MNRTMLIGRLTRDPEVRYSDSGSAIARYTLAVNRNYRTGNGNGQAADFISCVCFGQVASFVEKHLHKGIKLAVTGRIQTGSYVNMNGVKVYTTDVVVENHEFCESKSPTD